MCGQISVAAHVRFCDLRARTHLLRRGSHQCIHLFSGTISAGHQLTPCYQKLSCSQAMSATDPQGVADCMLQTRGVGGLREGTHDMLSKFAESSGNKRKLSIF